MRPAILHRRNRVSGRINVRQFIGRPEYLREVRQRPEPEAASEVDSGSLMVDGNTAPSAGKALGNPSEAGGV